MVEIKIIESKEEWNKNLKKTVNYNIFSTFEWGEYKSSSWKVERLAFFKGGNFLGQTQFLIKAKFSITFAWNSGGINLVDYKDLDRIVEGIKSFYKEKNYNFRFNFYDENNGKNIFEVSKYLLKAKRNINSGFSIIHDVGKDVDLLKSFSSNHRYYYKKAIKNNLEIKFEKNILREDFVKLHHEMTSSKDLEHLRIDRDDIFKLTDVFENNYFIASVYLNEKIVGSCLVFTFEDYAFYYLAASNNEGRKTYASYFMIKELLEYLKLKNIKTFDFAGITPYDKSALGVNKFKIGFNGRVANYIGEYELFNSKISNTLFNTIIGRLK